MNQFISTVAKHTEFAVLTIKITGSKKTGEPKFVLDKEVKGFKWTCSILYNNVQG